MGNINKSYMRSLLKDANNGDSNSFATIYAITYGDVYDRCRRVISNEYDIQDIMFQTYNTAYQNIGTVPIGMNLFKWIDCIFEGYLKAFLTKKGESVTDLHARTHPFFRFTKHRMSSDNAEQLLESVFMFAGAPTHTVSMGSLVAYYHYRNNKMYLQKVILLLVVLALFAIPFFTITPTMTVSFNEATSKYNQAHYTVDVNSILPVDTVIATMGGKNVTVMIEGDKIYDANATENGKMTITTTAINGKSVMTEVEVTTIDKTDPVVESYALENGQLVIYAKDEGSGIDSEKSVVAKLSEGAMSGPLEYDPATGRMVFNYYVGDTGLTVYDIAGNYSTYTIQP